MQSHFRVQPNCSVEVVLCCAVVGVVPITKKEGYFMDPEFSEMVWFLNTEIAEIQQFLDPHITEMNQKISR